MRTWRCRPLAIQGITLPTQDMQDPADAAFMLAFDSPRPFQQRPDQPNSQGPAVWLAGHPCPYNCLPETKWGFDRNFTTEAG